MSPWIWLVALPALLYWGGLGLLYLGESPSKHEKCLANIAALEKALEEKDSLDIILEAEKEPEPVPEVKKSGWVKEWIVSDSVVQWYERYEIGDDDRLMYYYPSPRFGPEWKKDGRGFVVGAPPKKDL